jgi:LacI family transcriptional regulator
MHDNFLGTKGHLPSAFQGHPANRFDSLARSFLVAKYQVWPLPANDLVRHCNCIVGLIIIWHPMKNTSTPPRSIAVCIDTRDGAGRYRLQGVSQYIRQLGWRMMLVRTQGKAAAEQVASLKPEGIIAYVANRQLIAVARRLNVPLVDTALGENPVPMSVSLDDVSIARVAAAHLAETGLKHFAYCGVQGRPASELRRKGFAEYFEGQVLKDFSETADEGELRMTPLMDWLKKLPKPVGLFVFDDKLGERVLTACRWAKLNVPEQVAVVGVGNDELMCEVCWPTLSSVHLSTVGVGYEAAKMLVQTMTGKKIKQPHLKTQPTVVVPRGSTDMVAVDDDLVKTAVRFISAQAGTFIGVKQIAQTLKVSRRNLDRRFKDALKRTVREELARVRMQMARTLLADFSLSIAQVACKCGYGGSASFSRAFRQHSGCWPSEHRDVLRQH